MYMHLFSHLKIKKLYKAELYMIVCTVLWYANWIRDFEGMRLTILVFTKVGMFCTFKKKLIFIAKRKIFFTIFRSFVFRNKKTKTPVKQNERWFYGIQVRSISHCCVSIRAIRRILFDQRFSVAIRLVKCLSKKKKKKMFSQYTNNNNKV